MVRGEEFGENKCVEDAEERKRERERRQRKRGREGEREMSSSTHSGRNLSDSCAFLRRVYVAPYEDDDDENGEVRNDVNDCVLNERSDSYLNFDVAAIKPESMYERATALYLSNCSGITTSNLTKEEWYMNVSPRFTLPLERALRQFYVSSPHYANLDDYMSYSLRPLSISGHSLLDSDTMLLEERLVHEALLFCGFDLSEDSKYGSESFMSEAEREYVLRKDKVQDNLGLNRIRLFQEVDKNSGLANECSMNSLWNKSIPHSDNTDTSKMSDSEILGNVVVRTVQFSGAESCLLAVGMISYNEDIEGSNDSGTNNSPSQETHMATPPARKKDSLNKVSIECIKKCPLRARQAWTKLIDHFATCLKKTIVQKRKQIDEEQAARAQELSNMEMNVDEPRSPPSRHVIVPDDVALFKLPGDVLHNIVSRLSALDLCYCMLSSRFLNNLCDDNELWISHCKKDFNKWGGCDVECTAVQNSENLTTDKQMDRTNNKSNHVGGEDMSDARYIYCDLMNMKIEKHKKEARQKAEIEARHSLYAQYHRRNRQHQMQSHNFNDHLGARTGLLYSSTMSIPFYMY